MPKWKKGLWALGLQAPVIFVAFFLTDVQQLITYTAGTTGVFIMFITPAVLYIMMKRKKLEELYNRKNFNKSVFSKFGFVIVVLAFAAFSLGTVAYGMVTGKGGGH